MRSTSVISLLESCPHRAAWLAISGLGWEEWPVRSCLDKEVWLGRSCLEIELLWPPRSCLEIDWWAAMSERDNEGWLEWCWRSREEWFGRLMRLFWEEELILSSHLSFSNVLYGPGFFSIPLSEEIIPLKKLV